MPGGDGRVAVDPRDPRVGRSGVARLVGQHGRVATGVGGSTSGPRRRCPAKIVATKNNATRLVLLCQVKGEKVDGTRRTTTMWNKVKGGGYVSDAYVKRGKAPLASAPRRPQSRSRRPPAARPSGSPASAQALGSGFHTKARPTHDGVDLGAPRGTRIRAAADRHRDRRHVQRVHRATVTRTVR